MPDKDRIINYAQGERINENLEGIKNAIIAHSASNLTENATWAGVSSAIKLGGAPTLFPVRTTFEVARDPAVSLHVGTVFSTETGGITSATVDKEKFLAHEGVVSGGKTLRLVYDGQEWRLGSEAGDKAEALANYGVAVTGGTLKEGDLIEVFEEPTKYSFEVVQHNSSYLQSGNMVLLGVRSAYSQAFGAPQLLFCATKKAMPAGKYKVTFFHAPYLWSDNADTQANQDGSFVFVTTKEIPQYGGFSHSTIGNNDKRKTVDGTFSTYGITHDSANPLESGIVTKAYDPTEDADAVDLGVFTNTYRENDGDGNAIEWENDFGIKNFTHNVFFGSGDYAVSQIDESLNSELTSDQIASSYEGDDFAKLPFRSYFNMKPSKGYPVHDGFLHGLQDDFKSHIATVEVSYTLEDPMWSLMQAKGYKKPLGWTDKCDAVVDGRKITMKRKIFLPSCVELGGSSGQEKNVGLACWDRYAGLSNASTPERQKLNASGTDYGWWWLRSSYLSMSCLAWVAYGDGYLDVNFARGAGGAVPACVVF